MFKYQKNHIKYAERTSQQKEQQKIRALKIAGLVTITAILASVATYLLVDTFDNQPDTGVNLTSIEENYFLKEEAKNYKDIKATTPTEGYVSKDIVSEKYLLKSDSSSFEGIDTDYAIDKTIVGQRYLLKEGATNVEGITANSILDEYVPKSYVTKNYLALNSDSQVQGVLSDYILNPADVTTKYWLRAGEDNLPDVNSDETPDHVLKSYVSQNYKLKEGETQLDGVIAEKEPPPSTYQVISELANDADNSNTEKPIKYIYIPIVKNESLDAGLQFWQNVQLVDAVYYQTRYFSLGGNGDGSIYVTNSAADFTNKLTSLIVQPGETKTYYLRAKKIPELTIKTFFNFPADKAEVLATYANKKEIDFFENFPLRRYTHQNSFSLKLVVSVSDDGKVTYAFPDKPRLGGVGANAALSTVTEQQWNESVDEWTRDLFGIPVIVR